MFSLVKANLHLYHCAYFYEYSGLRNIIAIIRLMTHNPCNMAHVLVMWHPLSTNNGNRWDGLKALCKLLYWSNEVIQCMNTVSVAIILFLCARVFRARGCNNVRCWFHFHRASSSCTCCDFLGNHHGYHNHDNCRLHLQKVCTPLGVVRLTVSFN